MIEVEVRGDLGERAGAWDDLVAQMPLPSPFLRSWWLANVAEGTPMFVLVVDGDELVGGLALQRGERAGVEWLEFLGSGPLEPDHLDVVASPRRAHEVCDALRGWLGRPGNRVVDLIGARSGAWALDAVPGAGEVTRIEPAPYVQLPPTAADYLASRPGAMRSTIVRTTKRLTRSGVRTVLFGVDDTEQALDALHRLHDGRWGDGSEFLRCWPRFSAAAHAGVAAGEMQFIALVDPTDDVVAIEVDFVVAGRVSFYQAGRRTDHDLRGSGSMLRFEIVTRAIEAGRTEFDLLRGAEPYKSDWSSGRRGLLRIRRGVGPLGAAMVGVARVNVVAQRARAALADRRVSGDRSTTRAPGASPPAGATLMFYSDAAQIGGAESVAKNLLRELDERFAVVVAGTTPAVVADIAAVRPSATTLLLPPIHDRSDVAAMVAHRRAIARVAPDIFHANLGEGSACQYALLAALSVRGVRTVVTENSPMGVRSELSRRIKRRSARRFDAHVAVGERAARLVEADVGLPEGSVATIPNGVPVIEHRPPERRDAGSVVGAVARFDPVKGLDLLIDAVARLEDVRLEIIGDGPERGDLERRIDSLGVTDRVHLLGWKSDVRHHLPNFDIVVLPSRLEGMPMVLIEAMQAGVATVATDVGSVREVVTDGVTGRVVPPEDPAALARAIAELLTDVDLRDRIAADGRAVALDRFTSAANVAAYEALYDRVLGRHQEPPTPADR